MKRVRPNWGWVCAAGAIVLSSWIAGQSPLGQKISFYLGSLVAVLVVAWGCVGVGERMGRALDLRMHPAEALPVWFALGQGAVGSLVLLMGLAGAFDLPGVSFGLLVALGTLAYAGLRRNAKDFLGAVRFRSGAAEALLAFVGLAGLAVAFLLCFLPPFEYDVLGYHMALPKRWLDAGRIHWTPDHVFGAFPLLIEMFFYLGLSWGQETFANLWVWTNLFFLALFTVGAVRDEQGRSTWLGPALLAGSPLCMRTASSAYNDLPLAMYALMALIVLWRGIQRGDRGWTMAAGLLAGFGMASKYHGFVFGWGCACLFCWAVLGGKSAFVSLVRFTAFAWLAVSPWLVRNVVWTGNPFFPLLSGWLGGGMLEAHVSAFSRAHAPPSFGLGSLLQALAAIVLSFGGALALLPWAVAKSKRAVRAFLVLMGGTLLFWLVATNRVDRFLCYSVAVWSFLLCLLWLRELDAPFRPSWVAGIVGGAGLAQLLCFVSTCQVLGLLDPVLGARARDEFLDTHVQCHAISRVLNDIAAPGDRAIMVGEARTYSFDTPVSTSYPFATPPIVSSMEQSRSPSELRDRLSEQGFAFLLLNVPSAERLAQAYDYFHPYERLWEDPLFVGFLHGYCREVAEERGIRLYRILTEEPETVPG